MTSLWCGRFSLLIAVLAAENSTTSSSIAPTTVSSTSQASEPSTTVTTSVATTSTTTTKPWTACPSRHLESCLQRALDLMVEHFVPYHEGLVLQLGFKSEAEDFGLASGLVDNARPARADDTFLYGSGTKPVTAVAVLRLIEAGKVKADDLVSPIVDPYLERWNGTTLRTLYGEAIDRATVVDVIRMSAGIRDFEDVYDFDVRVLQDGGYLEYPYGALRYASEIGNGTLYCEPGTCSAYSSTSYELAGLLLVAILQPEQAWWQFDLGSAAMNDRQRYPTMVFQPLATQSGKISDQLTVPGLSISSHWPSTTIFDQNSAILGWTCGNMVSSAQDVSRFYFDLLHTSGDPEAFGIIGNGSRVEMLNFETLSVGWSAGSLNYSAGLMELQYMYPESEGQRDGYSYAWGHPGFTYGFASTQAYAPKAGAAFSVVSNIDSARPSSHLGCWILDILQEVETGVPGHFNCGYIDFASTRRRRTRRRRSIATTSTAIARDSFVV